MHTSLLFVVVLTGACVTQAAHRPAPFRARPDTVDAGSLLGPFTGRVVDAGSRSPVSGAIVVASWALERGTGLSTPAGFREAQVSTDESGAYAIPALIDVPRDARVTDFTLVVYKAGFVGYRSDRRFADLGARRDFVQAGAEVALERWRSEYSHARHLRFLGGGAAISALTAWAVDDAAAELSAGRTDALAGRTGDGPFLVAAQLLSTTEIAAITGYDGRFETGPLEDEPDTAVYSSQHWKAIGRNPSWDIAVRMWRSDRPAALERYLDLAGGLPGVEELDEIATRSFRTTEKTVRGVGFVDGVRGLVVLLTCGESQCPTPETTAKIASAMHARIEALWPAGAM